VAGRGAGGRVGERGDFGSDLRRLVDDMFDTLYVAEGVGLAANQIGVDRRVFVYDCPDDDGRWHAGVVVNPRLADRGAERENTERKVADEGCLSVPGQYHPTPRATAARVVGLDLTGTPVEIEAEGFLARCFQHEIDHLNGHLYLELLSGDRVRDARAELTAGWQRTAGTDGSWLPALPEGFTGPITRDIVLHPERRRGPLVAGGC
jgi:peptide deformylase